MFLFVVSCLFLRIKQSIGEANHIPFLTHNEFKPFLRQHKRSVIFFTDQTLKFDFANYAIFRYSDKISFAACNISEGLRYGLSGPLAILPFEDGEIVKTHEAPTHAIAFTNWCDRLFSKDSIQIHDIEDLRIVFSSTITCCFGVDKKERPPKLKDSITFYSVPKKLLRVFRLNVSSGYYIYRSSDRQFVKFTTDPNMYLHSKVTDLHSVNLKKKRFFGGYFIHSNISDCQKESELLSPLATKYEDQMYLGLIYGSIAKTLMQQHSLSYFIVPLFILFDDNGRWIMENNENDDIHNYTKVCEFIDKVVSGKMNYTVMNTAGKPMSDDIKPLSYSNAMETINNDTTDAVLYITSAGGPKCKLFDILMKKEAEMMRNSTLTFYSLNASINEIPLDLPPGIDVPTMFLFPSGKRSLGPVPYDSYANIDEINRFLILESSGTFDKPVYNSSEIMKEAKQEAYPFLRSRKQENQTITTIPVKQNNETTTNSTEDLVNEL